MSQLVKKIRFTGTIELYSGLHIGASSENAEIGGVDKPVVRRKIDNVPYIPGSSIKGKIRCLLEQRRGLSRIGGNQEIDNLFGNSSENKPSKLIVRDANMNDASIELFEKNTNLDLPYSEIKFENTINRLNGTSNNLRQIERVPAGAKFDLEFVINVWDNDEEDGKKMIDLLQEGIQLLRDDYLGGSGSRGYGYVGIEVNQR